MTCAFQLSAKLDQPRARHACPPIASVPRDVAVVIPENKNAVQYKSK